MLHRPLALGITALALGAAPATALIIDDFEAGPITVADSEANDLLGVAAVGNNAEQSGLATTSVVGGVRLISVVATNPSLPLPDFGSVLGDLGVPLPIAPPDVPGTATATTAPILLPAVDDGVQFGAIGGGAFRIIYDGVAGGSTGSGSAGALDLDLSGFTHVAFHALGVTGGLTPDVPPAEARLRLSDSVLSASGVFVPIAEGVNLLPLSGFGFVDLGDIQQILLDVRGISTDSQLQLTLLEAVPEPSPGLLLALGVIALAAHRRPRRA